MNKFRLVYCLVENFLNKYRLLEIFIEEGNEFQILGP
jgi:hypothetical protein